MSNQPFSTQLRTSLPRAPMCPYCGHGPVVFKTGSNGNPLMMDTNTLVPEWKNVHPFRPHKYLDQ